MKRFDLKALVFGFVALIIAGFAVPLIFQALLVATGMVEWRREFTDREEYVYELIISSIAMLVAGYYAQRHSREDVIWNQALVFGLIFFIWGVYDTISLIGVPESDSFFFNLLYDLCTLAAAYLGGKLSKRERRL